MLENYDIFEDNINNVFQIRTKDEIFIVEFTNDLKKEVFKKVSDILKEDSDISYNNLIKKLKNYDKSIVLDILQELKQYDLLSSTVKDELPELDKPGASDSYYSEYAFTNTKGAVNIEEINIGIIGSNTVMMDFLSEKAKNFGYKHIQKLHLKSVKEEDVLKFIKESDFFIVDADDWNPYYLEFINKEAIKNEKSWLLIRGITGNSASIGPIFSGRDTGCYCCLNSRIKSNLQFLSYFEPYEDYLKKNKLSSKSFKPSPLIYDIISSIAILEISKFINNWAVPETWRHLINFNIFTYETQKHFLLKQPFCPVCKPEIEYNPSPWLESVTLK